MYERIDIRLSVFYERRFEKSEDAFRTHGDRAEFLLYGGTVFRKRFRLLVSERSDYLEEERLFPFRESVA